MASLFQCNIEPALWDRNKIRCSVETRNTLCLAGILSLDSSLILYLYYDHEAVSFSFHTIKRSSKLLPRDLKFLYSLTHIYLWLISFVPLKEIVLFGFGEQWLRFSKSQPRRSEMGMSHLSSSKWELQEKKEMIHCLLSFPCLDNLCLALLRMLGFSNDHLFTLLAR